MPGLLALLLLGAMGPARGQEAPPRAGIAEAVGEEREEASAQYAPSAAGQRLQVVDGEVVVVLEQRWIESTGIAAAPVPAVERPAAWEAFARVVDVSPLLAGRARHEQSRATEAIHQVEMDVARQEYQRLKQLSERGTLASPQDLQRALAQFRRQQALVRAEQVRQAAIFDELAQSWSVLLADAVLREDSALHDSLVSRDRVLVQLTLPAGRSLPRPGADVDVLLPAPGDEGRRVPASFVSPASDTDARIQGETFFYTMPGQGVRAGMRLTALVADERRRERGVLVPEPAVVWHDGRPWVYLALGDGMFGRRAVSSGEEVAGGWFLPVRNDAGIAPGDPVVVSGATTLLSEEFRWQIPEEDADDDDG